MTWKGGTNASPESALPWFGWGSVPHAMRAPQAKAPIHRLIRIADLPNIMWVLIRPSEPAFSTTPGRPAVTPTDDARFDGGERLDLE
jgi:hypothetical protein